MTISRQVRLLILVCSLITGWVTFGQTFVISCRSGFPLDPFDGATRVNTDIGVDQPGATGVSQSLANPTTAEWFNTAAFTLQVLCTLGDAGRDTTIGPARFYWDCSTHKSFRMPRESYVLQLRTEAFNSGLHRGEKCA
jgi:hypothetical protein